MEAREIGRRPRCGDWRCPSLDLTWLPPNLYISQLGKISGVPEVETGTRMRWGLDWIGLDSTGLDWTCSKAKAGKCKEGKCKQASSPAKLA